MSDSTSLVSMRIHPAADLWKIVESDTIEQKDSEKEIQIKSGDKAIDAMLDGGFAVGKLTYVTLEATTQLLPYANNLAATHLIASYESKILLLDVMNAFDVKLLYQTISDRLPGQASTAKDEQIMAIMERIQVYRIFDFEGLRATLGQTGEDLDQAEARQKQAGENTAKDQAISSDATIQLLIVGDVSYLAELMFKNNSTQSDYMALTFLEMFRNLIVRHNLYAVICEVGSPEENELTGCAFELPDPRSGRISPFDSIIDLHIHIRTKWMDSSAKQTTIDSTRVPPRAQAEVIEVVKDGFSDRHGRWTYRQLPNL